MRADALLSRLAGVRKRGRGRWLARCPAHDDRHASLSIRELDDGRILIHDFAGCDVCEILGALGLDFDALYPERALGDRLQRDRRPFPANDILLAVGSEALIVSVAAANVAHGVALNDGDRRRLMLASARLQRAAEMAHAE